MTDVWIVAARRTPQGRFMGSLSKLSAVELGETAGRAALGGRGSGHAGPAVSPEHVDQVVVGNVLGAGSGMNVARQIAVRLGLPVSVPAFTVNMMCASGMQAVALAAQAIAAGQAEVVLCGGTESMSRAPYLLERARGGYKLGDGVLVDSLQRDGLVDAFSGEHMGLTAERLAERYGIGRAEQDAFAAESQRRHAAATAAGRFADEIAPAHGLDHDEHARADATADKLAALKPAFRPDGTVTAGNASGINDGAAMLVVCDARAARRHGWEPLAAVVGSTVVGCEPELMGLGPVHATRRLCDRTGLPPDAFDAVELNEAFAAQALACLRELKLDAARVNPDGGAIAVGHPLAARGAPRHVPLAHRIARGEVTRGLATLCVGGGMGAAVALGRP
jgi:acetyl-CoA C-acetyltransferase